MSASSNKPITLTVIFQRGVESTKQELEIDADTTIRVLKEKVLKDNKFRVIRVFEKNKGRLEEMEKTFSDYNVTDGSVIILRGVFVNVDESGGDCNCQGECKCGNDQGCGCSHSVSMFRAKPE